MVLGVSLDPNSLGSTISTFKNMISNGIKDINNDSMSFVDVKDVAKMHIEACMDKNASGRYMCL